MKVLKNNYYNGLYNELSYKGLKCMYKRLLKDFNNKICKYDKMQVLKRINGLIKGIKKTNVLNNEELEERAEFEKMFKIKT